jgi:phosphate/sulfate permease
VQTDTVKVFYTYTVATILIVGGLVFLYLTRLDPPNSTSQSYGLLIAGFIGAAVQFVFNRETQTNTSRMIERVTAAAAAAQPTVTASAGPPATITTTPAIPGDQP